LNDIYRLESGKNFIKQTIESGPQTRKNSTNLQMIERPLFPMKEVVSREDIM